MGFPLPPMGPLLRVTSFPPWDLGWGDEDVGQRRGELVWWPGQLGRGRGTKPGEGRMFGIGGSVLDSSRTSPSFRLCLFFSFFLFAASQMEIKKPFILSSMKLPLQDSNNKVSRAAAGYLES